jgi:hypothetical protein
MTDEEFGREPNHSATGWILVLVRTPSLQRCAILNLASSCDWLTEGQKDNQLSESEHVFHDFHAHQI